MNYTHLKQTIEEQPLTGLQLVVIAICFTLNMMDGMDVLVISYSASLIMNEWNLPASQFGIVFSAGLFGMAIGAMLISPRADLIGRRKMIMISATVIATGMILSSYASSVLQLGILRLLTGIGIGSMLASVTSMSTEYSSRKRRNLVIGFVLAGYPIGATLTGFLAAWLLPEHGWRVLFLASGCISAMMLPLIYFLMPESLVFLAKRQPSGALQKCNVILKKMQLDRLENLPDLSTQPLLKYNVRTLFAAERKTWTIWLWVAFFMAFLSMYFIISWVPKLAVNAGLGLENAIYAGSLFNLGAFFGIILLGHYSNQFGLRRLIKVFFIFTVVFMLTYGWVQVPVPVMLAEIFLLGFFLQGAFIGLYAIAARIYPTEIRTMGVGWAIGAARTGAIIGPYIGGLTIAMGWSTGLNFTVFALPCLIAALAVGYIQAPALEETG